MHSDHIKKTFKRFAGVSERGQVLMESILFFTILFAFIWSAQFLAQGSRQILKKHTLPGETNEIRN